MPEVPGWLVEWDYTRTWYHGSPYQIDTLLPGSTITQDKDLARVFSHKPQIVAIEEDPQVLACGVPRLRHNGVRPGLLYTIAEPLNAQDVFPHPRSSMPRGMEWLTQRPLRLCRLGSVDIDPIEFLTAQAIDELMSKNG
jgi:hypothetical protein